MMIPIVGDITVYLDGKGRQHTGYVVNVRGDYFTMITDNGTTVHGPTCGIISTGYGGDELYPCLANLRHSASWAENHDAGECPVYLWQS